MLSATLSPCWQVFERLQHSIDGRIANAIAHASEEALSDLLDDFRSGTIPPEERIEYRFQSLRRNRIRKHRNRARLTFGMRSSENDVSPTTRVDDGDEIQFARSQMAAADWAVIERVACGDSCNQIAKENRLSPGQLRTRLSRLRSRLSQQVADRVHTAHSHWNLQKRPAHERHQRRLFT